MTNRCRFISLVLAALTVVACGPAETGDGAPESSAPECVEECGKADSYMLRLDPYLKLAILDVANTTEESMLIDSVGLLPVQVETIVAGRPFATYEEFDDTEGIGRGTIERLLEFVQAEGKIGFCGDGELQPSLEACDGTEGCQGNCEFAETVDYHDADVERFGTLAGFERRVLLLPARAGDQIVVAVHQGHTSSWVPSFDLELDGTVVARSGGLAGSARLPAAYGDLSVGHVFEETGEHALVIENSAAEKVSYYLSIVCVGGTCADRPHLDSDGDEIPDYIDLCPFLADRDQLDSDGDGVGDACEADTKPDALEGLFGDDFEEAFRSTYRHVASSREAILENYDAEDGKLTCVYTGLEIDTEGMSHIRDMNVEHVWPKSHGGADWFHNLLTTWMVVNSRRGNRPYGEVVEVQWASPFGDAVAGLDSAGNEVFQPPVGARGDVARATFWFALMRNKDIDQRQEAVLRRWHAEDPPSWHELRRQQKLTSAFEGDLAVRNPFVDHPSLVGQVADF